MKRKLVLTSAVVLILALLAAGTFAYFTKNARTTNVITTGTISIQAASLPEFSPFCSCFPARKLRYSFPRSRIAPAAHPPVRRGAPTVRSARILPNAASLCP